MKKGEYCCAVKKERFCTFFRIWWDNLKSMVLLNIVHSALSLTLLPGGLAAVGMANVTDTLVQGRYFFSFKEYWDGIKKCWKQALIAGIINLLFTALLLLSFWFYLSTSGMLFVFGMGCCLLAAVISSFMKYYLWPQMLLLRLPLTSIYKNSFIFAALNLKSNLLIGLVSLLCYAVAAVVLLYVPYLVSVIVIVVLGTCVFPGFKQLLVQYVIFPFLKEYMIDPYYAAHPDGNGQEIYKPGVEK